MNMIRKMFCYRILLLILTIAFIIITIFTNPTNIAGFIMAGIYGFFNVLRIIEAIRLMCNTNDREYGMTTGGNRIEQIVNRAGRITLNILEVTALITIIVLSFLAEVVIVDVLLLAMCIGIILYTIIYYIYNIAC